MNVDLFKLNNLGSVELDSDVELPNDYLTNTDIVNIKNLHIKGVLSINYDENIDMIGNINGIFILNDAYTWEEIEYPCDVSVDETIGKYEDFYVKNKNRLDILPFIWENIVSEVPMKVTKEEEMPKLEGDGWKLE